MNDLFNLLLSLCVTFTLAFVGALGFGVWMDNSGAGLFMFVVLMWLLSFGRTSE
jgi:nitrate reductase NapE component